METINLSRINRSKQLMNSISKSNYQSSQSTKKQNMNNFMSSSIKKQSTLSYNIIKKTSHNKSLLNDFIATKQKSHHKSNQRINNLYLLCHTQKQKQSFHIQKQLKHQLLPLLNQPHNILFPQQNIKLNSSLYQAYHIKSIQQSILLRQQQENLFVPIEQISKQQKCKSELYCLTIFYLFIEKCYKPIVNFVQNVRNNQQNFIEIFKKILIKQNILYSQYKNQVYLIFCLRSGQNINLASMSKTHLKIQNINQKQEKQQDKQDKQDKNSLKSENKSLITQADLFSKISKIFWQIFYPQHKFTQQNELFITFMKNYLASCIKKQLTFHEALQILQNKQKRKQFMNKKTNVKYNNISKRSYMKQKKPNDQNQQQSKHPENYSNKIYLQQYNIKNVIHSQFTSNIDNKNKKHTKKSVKRRLLSQNRHTIDASNLNTINQMVPPSFINRSRQKKSKLFNYENKRKSVSTSINYSNNDDLTLSPSRINRYNKVNEGQLDLTQMMKKRNMSNYTINFNIEDNFSFINKNKNQSGKVSQTLDIEIKKNMSNINDLSLLKNNSKQFKPVNSYLTNTISEKSVSELNPSKNTIQNNQNTQKVDQFVPYKSIQKNIVKNRRYYHVEQSKQYYKKLDLQSNNIQNLLKKYKKQFNSKSKQKDLLSKSCQRALEFYYKQMVKNNKNDQNKNKQEINSAQTKLKSLLKGMKQSKTHSVRYNNEQVKQSQQRVLLQSFKHEQSNKKKNKFEFSPPKSIKKYNNLIQNSPVDNFINDSYSDAKFKLIDDKDFKMKFYQKYSKIDVFQDKIVNENYKKQKVNKLEIKIPNFQENQTFSFEVNQKMKQTNKNTQLDIKYDNKQLSEQKPTQSKQKPKNSALKITNLFMINNEQQTKQQKQNVKKNLILDSFKQNQQKQRIKQIQKQKITIKEDKCINVDFTQFEIKVQQPIEYQKQKQKQIKNQSKKVRQIQVVKEQTIPKQQKRQIEPIIQHPKNLIKQQSISKIQTKIIPQLPKQQSTLERVNSLSLIPNHEDISQSITNIQQIVIYQRQPQKDFKKPQINNNQNNNINEKPLTKPSIGNKKSIVEKKTSQKVYTNSSIDQKSSKNKQRTVVEQDDDQIEQISLTKKGPTKNNKNDQKNIPKPPIVTPKKQPSPPVILHQQQQDSSALQRKRSQRQHTNQSSVASSSGPPKSVKKMLDEYVFMINKMGQAVSRTQKVIKKIQPVTQWNIGIFFLYKRFLFQRKRIQKWLVQKIPNITRYNVQINQQEWKQYVNSTEYTTLLNKIKQENLNIIKSIQKMKKKIDSKQLPQSIKPHLILTQRSSQQSRILVQKIIDQFDELSAHKMLEDQQILLHCTEVLNACLIVSELDGNMQQLMPILKLTQQKRTSEELDIIAQDLFDIYHEDDESNHQNK